MTPKPRLACLAALFCASCAIAPERVAQESDLEVCRSLGVYRGSALFGASASSYEAEARRRNLLTEEEWGMVAAKRVKIGMSRCAMYVTFGKPDRENATTSSYGRHVQHVFNSGYRYIKAYYIYTDNDRVVSWQD